MLLTCLHLYDEHIALQSTMKVRDDRDTSETAAFLYMDEERKMFYRAGDECYIPDLTVAPGIFPKAPLRSTPVSA